MRNTLSIIIRSTSWLPFTMSGAYTLGGFWITCKSKVRRRKIAFERSYPIQVIVASLPFIFRGLQCEERNYKYYHTSIHSIVSQSPGITCSTAQISRVWTPPTPSAHSSHPSNWNQTWVTAVKYHRTIGCTSVVGHSSILRGNRRTTVNWGRVKFSE